MLLGIKPTEEGGVEGEPTGFGVPQGSVDDPQRGKVRKENKKRI